MNSELLTQSECASLFEQAQRAAASAGVRDVEVSIQASSESLTRFANNEIHQNVSERVRGLAVRVVVDGRTARVATNRLHRDAIASTVEQCIALARASWPDPDLQPLYTGPRQPASARHDGPTAACTPATRAAGVAEAIDVVRGQGQTAAGIFSTTESVEAILNSTGLSCYYSDTLAQFSITAMADQSSGWAKASSPRVSDFSPAVLARQASWKAAHSSGPVAVDPGEYTVVLEPAAVLDLVGQIFGDFSATAVADQRSFLNDRIGEKLFGDNISIWDEVNCPLQVGAPFDGEGVPRQRLHLVDRGVVRDVARSRVQAAKSGLIPTGHGFPLPNDMGEAPVNIVMAGGRDSVEDLIRGVSKGILVTRLWYIREVEPYEKIMTGMTRDGTFLISGGEIGPGIRNMRFNQSVVKLLNSVEALSESVRASGEEAFDMVVPGRRAANFNFTEITRY